MRTVLPFIVFTLLLLQVAPAVLTGQPDTLQQDTLLVREGSLLNELNEETKSLSSYFSFSKILISIMIFIATYLFLRILSLILGAWAERNVRHRVTIKGFIPLARIIVWTGSLTFILVAVFRPPMASILAFTASIGVAIGFASQDLLKNIFGGMIIIFDKPFQIGDKVQIGNFYGEVVGIGLRSTRIVTADDNLVSVPNSEVMNLPVANANAGEETCQVVTEVYLPLNCDMDRVRQFAIETAQVSRHIYLNKPVVVLFAQQSNEHRVLLKVKVKAYVNDIRNEFAFRSEITEVLTREFSEYFKDNLGGIV